MGERSSARRLVLLAASSLLAVFFGFFALRPLTAVTVAREIGVYVVAAVFVAFLVFLWRIVPWAGLVDRELWKRHAWGILLIALVAAFLISREPADFKVLWDEVVLAEAAMGLHFDRDPAIMTRGHEILGVFLQMGAYLDKRPLFYPFLVAGVHDLIGYSVANSFLLNRLLTVVLCGLLYGFAVRLQGVRAGILALCLLAGIPLLAQNASGGGFEILNLVMLLAAMHLAVVYLKEPSCTSQGAFLACLLLLAHTRYESGIFVVVGAGIILHSWWRARRVMVWWPLIVAPLALVTLPMQLQVIGLDPDSFMQYEPGVSSAFGLSFVPGNLVRAFDFFFLLSQKTYGSPLVAGAGSLAVVLLLLYLARAHREGTTVPDAVKSLGLFSLGAAAVFAVIMCYSWGHLNEYEASRLALPFFVMAILLTVFALTWCAPSRRVFHVAMVVALVYLWTFALPASARRYPSRRNHDVRRLNWCLEQVHSLPRASYLIVSADRPFWALQRVSAVPPWLADLRAAEIDYHLRHRTFAEALVFQKIRIDPVTGEESTLGDSRVAAFFELETVAEASFRPFVYCRMSRVVAIDQERRTGAEAPTGGQALRRGIDMPTIEQRLIEDYLRRLP